MKISDDDRLHNYYALHHCAPPPTLPVLTLYQTQTPLEVIHRYDYRPATPNHLLEGHMATSRKYYIYKKKRFFILKVIMFIFES